MKRPLIIVIVILAFFIATVALYSTEFEFDDFSEVQRFEDEDPVKIIAVRQKSSGFSVEFEITDSDDIAEIMDILREDTAYRGRKLGAFGNRQRITLVDADGKETDVDEMWWGYMSYYADSAELSEKIYDVGVEMGKLFP